MRKLCLWGGSSIALFFLGLALVRAEPPEKPAAAPHSRPAPSTTAAPGPAPQPDAPSERPTGETRRATRLNELGERLAGPVSEGKIAPQRVVELFKSETDSAALDLLQGVLSRSPDVLEARESMIDVARADVNPARRQAAVAFLGSLRETDRCAGEALLDLARSDPAPPIRLGSLTALNAYARRNLAAAESVQAVLRDLARSDRNAGVRAKAAALLEGPSTQDVPPPRK